MNIDTDDGRRFPTAATSGPSPFYNVISIVAPILGVVAVFVFVGIFGNENHWYGSWQAATAMGILGGSCFLGFVLAFIALARSERLWGLTAVGLILNSPLLVLLLWAALSNLESWLRYG
jgi:hypothetical protein